MKEELFKDYVVKKPWGHEYLAYENEELSVWLLYLKHNAETSLHCHPNKKTSLILLDGKAEISFITSKIQANELFKIVIWDRVFHSTKALSENGIYVTKDDEIANIGDDEIIALLGGNIFSERGDKLLMPGDAVKGDAFKKFIKEFPYKNNLLLLRIKK